jgi:hypothetical protein
MGLNLFPLRTLWNAQNPHQNAGMYKTNSESQIRMTDAATYQAIPLIYCTVIGRGYFNPPVMSKQYDLPLLRC